MANSENQGEVKSLRDSQINKALGSFLLFFALVVLFAILFTDTGIGKLTNLGAGAVIGVIGGAMLWKGLRTSRREKGQDLL